MVQASGPGSAEPRGAAPPPAPDAPRTAVDADLLREWVRRGLGALGRARGSIDALNVFPVPDGDTGTNMYLTVEAAARELEHAGSGGDARDALVRAGRALCRGALLGARGNSGVILSQLARGLAQGLVADAPPGRALAAGLAEAARQGYAAVAEPVEGTILSVVAAASAAAEATGSDDLAATALAAAEGARDALARTPAQLPALRAAGVVDAGGRGLVVLLDALAEVVTGAPPPQHPDTATGTVQEPPPGGNAAHPGYTGPDYEVMYLLEASDGAVDALRARLAELGDSLVVVGGDGLWNVHVHADDAGAAVEAALGAGRPYRIRITSLAQASALRECGRGRQGERALVAVSHGPGVAALLAGAGATVVPARPRRPPSTGELLDAVARAGTHEVVLLPSDRDTLAAAEASASRAREDGVRVSVIPTRSVVQTLAAVAVHDAAARFDDDVVAMTRAAGATRYGAVTVSAREAATRAGPVRAGDVLGLVDGDILEAGDSVDAVARAVLARLLSGGGELVTLVLGAPAGPGLAPGLVAWLEEGYPGAEPVVLDGGQPLWPLIVGVE